MTINHDAPMQWRAWEDANASLYRHQQNGAVAGNDETGFRRATPLSSPMPTIAKPGADNTGAQGIIPDGTPPGGYDGTNDHHRRFRMSKINR